jgi:hypothetical protein
MATTGTAQPARRPGRAIELWDLLHQRDPEFAAGLDTLLTEPCGPGCRVCPQTAREAPQEPAGRPSGA